MSMTFNERVRTVWKEKRPDIKSVRNLEERIGLSNGTIASWKKSNPSQTKIEQVANFFGVSVDYLLGNTDDMHANKKDDPSTPELIAAHWGIDLSELSDEEKGFVMGRAQDYVKGLVDAIEGRK